MSQCDIPNSWLTTIITGIPKNGKSADKVENYCIIALESCLLKALTLIIHKKLSTVVERAQILPPSQNGFHEIFHVSNNVFVLCSLIDKSLSAQETLYIAFVDIKNASPSTNHSSSWLKLHHFGLTGCFFDWIQKLYAHMKYITCMMDSGQRNSVLSQGSHW